MDKLLIILSIILCSTLILPNFLYERVYWIYAGSKNNLSTFIKKYNECSKYNKIDQARCPEYAASMHNLSNYIKRYNKFKSMNLSESATFFAASNKSINTLLKRNHYARNSKMLNSVMSYTYFAISDHDLIAFKKRYDEISKTYPKSRYGNLSYACSNYNLNVYLKRYNDIKSKYYIKNR